jgi:hypothetical protein
MAAFANRSICKQKHLLVLRKDFQFFAFEHRQQFILLVHESATAFNQYIPLS